MGERALLDIRPPEGRHSVSLLSASVSLRMSVVRGLTDVVVQILAWFLVPVGDEACAG